MEISSNLTKTFKPKPCFLVIPLTQNNWHEYDFFPSSNPSLPLVTLQQIHHLKRKKERKKMSSRFRNLLTQLKLWRIVGFVSSVIGLLCYVLSLSFNFKHVGGVWRILKISLYGVVSFTIICVMLFAMIRKGQFSKSLMLKAHMGVSAVMITSLYSFFGDKAKDEKTDVFSLISNGAFALMSLSLSKQFELGLEVEILNFYLECLTIQLMKINLGLSLVGAAFCYLLMVLHSHSYSDSQLDIENDSHGEHVAIEIDTAKEEETEADTDHIKQLYSILGIEIKSGETVMYPQDLETKLMEAMAAGFVKECYHVFCSWRRQFLEDKLLKMELENLIMSNEEVHKMPLKYLKDEIERWIKASNDVFRMLFPYERHLCDRVFFGFSPFADLSFIEICHQPTIHLLNFANAVATTTRSPERLFRILQVFETLNDLKPALESMFSDEYSVVLWNEAITVSKRLREAIRGVFMELENLIRQHPAKVVISGGGLHPTNRYVMNYLFGTCQCWKTLELAFDDEGSPSSSSSSSSSLSLQVAQILELLETNLKANSKIYKDSSLCSIFMMNNWRYIVHKVKKCELGKVLGDEWIQKHIAKMQQYLVNYQRSSWDQVLDMLNIDNESLAPDINFVAAQCWKEKLELFRLQFEEICQMQSTWVVFDDQLREVMKSSLKKILLPAFENFIARFQNAVDPREDIHHLNKDFGVQDVVALIDKLFQGQDEHRNQRNIQPTWTVVLPSTQDFHEWRKYAEKKILNSTYPRKHYRCIYKNDQGCRARKYVQQIQENPKMYMTSYRGFHTCSVLYASQGSMNA